MTFIKADLFKFIGDVSDLVGPILPSLETLVSLSILACGLLAVLIMISVIGAACLYVWNNS